MPTALSWNLREHSSLIYRALHLFDCALVCFILWLLVTLYEVPWSPYYSYLEGIVLGLSFFSFHSFQLYRSWRGWKYYREFFVIVKAWAAVIAGLLLYFFFFKVSDAYSRVVFMVWSLGMPMIIFCGHFAVRKLLRYYRAKGNNIRHAVIVGGGELGLRTARQVESTPWAGIQVLGFFDDKASDAENKLSKDIRPLLGQTSELKAYLASNDIDYVYIALPLRAEKKIFRILSECRDLGARIFLVPDLYTFGLHHAEIQSLGELLILNFNPEQPWKRAFDVGFSLLALLLTAPLFLFVALLVRVDSPGPIFYRHQRIAAQGKTFGCLKFRTMAIDAEERLQAMLESDPVVKAEWEKSFKLKNDPRVTRIGRFLRRTSLDEFPQFLNVLKGEMSVVGARPIVGKELEDYYRPNSEQSAGLYCSMKPGITGPWQVLKRNDMEDYRERVELDDWYVLNYSLWYDLRIIALTVLRVFSGKGAY